MRLFAAEVLPVVEAWTYPSDERASTGAGVG